MTSAEIIKIKNLGKKFFLKKSFFSKDENIVKACDDISLSVRRGETVGLVGESGCGKSTLGRTIIKLHEPDTGKIFFKDSDITGYSYYKMKELRKELQIIFQNPYSSLNPRMTVEQIVMEPVINHKIISPGKNKKVTEYIEETLEKCGLSKSYKNRYPHQFSGGERQRIGIARALALKPSFIVCDEPVSALDVSIQSQILNLCMDLQEEMNIAYLFISHDLSVVKHIANRIAVMYLGVIVELADKEELFANPLHPYTKALLSAIPEIDPVNNKKRIILPGDMPSNIFIPSGCRFHTRCKYADEKCKNVVPELKYEKENHLVACHKA